MEYNPVMMKRLMAQRLKKMLGENEGNGGDTPQFKGAAKESVPKTNFSEYSIELILKDSAPVHTSPRP